jgi:hypothetical protein
MKKNLNKSINNPNAFTYPELNNYSSIFQLFYNKNVKKDNNQINNINTNKTEELLNLIEDMRLNEEMVETDKDYLIKESRKEIKMNQEMINLFGIRRSRHKKTTNLGKIKLDKKIFINPAEKKIQKKYLLSKNRSNVNILKLPLINKNYYNNKQLHISKSVVKKINNYRPSQHKLFLSEGNSAKVSFNDSGSNTNDEDSKKINDNIPISNSCKNIKKNRKRNMNSFLKSTTSRSVKNPKLLSSRTINLIFVNHKYSSDIDILNDFATNKSDKRPVINLLNNINEELKLDEKKHKKYFRINDYGCEFSKFKIKFLEKHFFH